MSTNPLLDQSMLPLQTPNECRKCRGFMMNYRSEEFYARIYAHKGNS